MLINIVNYIVSDYQVYDKAWKYIGDYDGRFLYENVDLNCVGLLYNGFYTYSDIENMSDIEKQAVFNVGIVLDDSENFLNYQLSDSEVEFSEYDLPDFEQQIDSEMNINGMCEKEFEILEIDTEQMWLQMRISSNVTGSFQYLCDTGFGYYEGYWANGTKTYENGDNVINIKIPIGTKKVKIIFQEDSNLKILGMKLCTVDQHMYTNEGVNLMNKGLSGTIEGTVTISSNKFLFLPVIYDSNWTASIDGKIIDIERADYAFMGIYIPAGKHEILLKYHTPGIETGKVISVIGICIYFIILLYNKRHFHRFCAWK